MIIVRTNPLWLLPAVSIALFALGWVSEPLCRFIETGLNEQDMLAIQMAYSDEYQRHRYLTALNIGTACMALLCCGMAFLARSGRILLVIGKDDYALLTNETTGEIRRVQPGDWNNLVLIVLWQGPSIWKMSEPNQTT